MHGGRWTKGYATLRNTAPLTSALTQHGTAKAAACGDKVEILDVVNGGYFDISAPGTKAWDQVETFILDHAFDQTATHTP
jgi:hypothetical protein